MEYVQTGALNNDFRTCLAHLMQNGMTANPRGTTTREHLNYNISLMDPRNRIVNFPDRKTNVKYLLGELIWYFGGSNDPDGILPYSKFWDQIRNSGEFMGPSGYLKGTINSNYGHRLFGHDERMNVPYLDEVKIPSGMNIVGEMVTQSRQTKLVRGESQWQSVIDMLTADKDSRQAIMNIHRPSDRHVGNKDVPCTLTLQWFIRTDHLHLIVNMRSNDVILGFTNDVFQFTMLQECMLVQLKAVYPDLKLGHYFHNAGSMHIYDRHFEMANKIIADERALEMPMVEMDQFDAKIMLGLKIVEMNWRSAGMKTDFDFKANDGFKMLTPYWQNLVLFCFAEDHEAMHNVFGLPEHA